MTPTSFSAIVRGETLLLGGLFLGQLRRGVKNDPRRNEERYPNVIDTQHELIYRCLPDTTLTFTNDAFCRFFERPRITLMGTKLLELMPVEARDQTRHFFESLVTDPRTELRDHEVLRTDGTIAWQQWVVHAITNASGEVVEFQGIGRDVTDRKRAEEALAHSEAKIRAVLHAQPDLMFVLSNDGVYLDYHAGDGLDLHVSPDQFLGKHVRDVMPESLAEQFCEAFGRVRQSADPIAVEYSLSLHGEERHFEARLVPLEEDRILSVVRDITERRRHEAELRENASILSASLARNLDLSRRLMTIQEAERQRIARNLHDDLSQQLALLNIDIEQMGRAHLESTEAFEARVGKLSRRVGEIASTVHRVSLELHPIKLRSIGLVAAIHGACRDVSARHEIQVDFNHVGPVHQVSDQVSLCLYRILQEALHNAVKHSGAQRVSVLLSSEAGTVHLQIADSGVGFDMEKGEGAGLGLVSMRERVNLVGGRLEIHSGIGSGTRVGVRVPLQSTDAESS